MYKLMLGAAAAAMAITGAPAMAQDYHHDHRNDHGHYDHHHGDRYDHGHRGDRDRYDPRSHYRSHGYRPIRVTRRTRIYRGGDGRYYCRRSDGTTGLIVGAALGGVAGNALADGNSSLLGTLLGAGAGGLVGRSIDRGHVSCR